MLGAVNLHILEEFVSPGGFVGWYRRYRVDASGITTRSLIIINAALMIACWDMSLWVSMPSSIFCGQVQLDDDCADRSRYWWFVSLLLCTFS